MEIHDYMASGTGWAAKDAKDSKWQMLGEFDNPGAAQLI
jgi:hypothetical protein